MEVEKMKILPRPDNEYRTQEQAIVLHNERKEIMLGLPNLFQLWKENNIEALESVRKDFDPRWLVLSDRIIYDPENLPAKIIHNADSTVTKQTEINLKEVPVCRPTYLKELLETEAGLSYIRALLDDKKATKEQITNFFVALSGKKEENIRFWTPDQDSRKSKQFRSVGLVFGVFGGFVVNGNNWFDSGDGLSRGVIVSSAKQTKKSRGKSK